MTQSWAGALRYAVLRLGLTPETFWRLTLWEWRCLAGPAAASGGVMSRERLNALLTRYPQFDRNEVKA
jgi:uncharacterized phage protein (TIGR02216 family)